MNDFEHRTKREALLLIIVGVLFFAGYFITQFTSTAPYNPYNQTVSELGITTCSTFTEPLTKQTFDVCSPNHLILDGTFILNGFLIMIAVRRVLRSLWVGRKLRKIGLLLIFFGGLEEFITGFSPLNLALTLHIISGGLAIFSLNLGMFLLGLAARKQMAFLGWLSILAGILGLAGFLEDGIPPYRWLGYGGWERVAGFTFEVWITVVGLYLLYEARKNKGIRRSEL
jgi:hypothetical protein